LNRAALAVMAAGAAVPAMCSGVVASPHFTPKP